MVNIGYLATTISARPCYFSLNSMLVVFPPIHTLHHSMDLVLAYFEVL